MYKIDSNLSIKKLNSSSTVLDIINNKNYDKIFIITEKKIYNLYDKHEIFNANFNIIFIKSGENAKTLKETNYIIEELTKDRATRDSLVIGLGGGAITDIAGFVASIYMRGINHIFIPTTLLAMVDASIGGKTGVNFQGIKNLVGTFKKPEAIFIDVNFLNTLDSNYIIDGFSEIIKYGLIFDRQFFEIVIKNFNSLITITNIEKIESIIIKSCEYKINIVLKDQFDNNKRMILNFGHTIGHALETYFVDKKISHGQAIYYGMIIESLVSFELGYLSEDQFNKIRVFINSVTTVKIQSNDEKEIYKLIGHDKKQLRNKMHFIILNQIGDAIIKENIPPKIIINSIKKILG